MVLNKKPTASSILKLSIHGEKSIKYLQVFVGTTNTKFKLGVVRPFTGYNVLQLELRHIPMKVYIAAAAYGENI